MYLLHHSKCLICGLRSELAEAVAQHQHILYPTYKNYNFTNEQTETR